MAGNLKAILAELIGTFAIVLIGAGAICADAATSGKLGWPGIALAQGMILAAMYYVYSQVSGGHFNPAITIGMYLHGRSDTIRTVFYIAAQLLGAALAGVLLKALFHDQVDLAANSPYLGACGVTFIGYRGATLLEAVGTFFLVTAYEVGSDARRAAGGIAPLAVGVAWGACVLAIGPFTGAALNPARAFGPSIVTGHWPYWFVYWIGPLVGSIASVWLYETIYVEKKGASA